MKLNSKILLVLFSFMVINICYSKNLKEEIFGYYLSVQKVENLDKIMLYHFSQDSLKIYNSTTDQIFEYKAEYTYDHIIVSNKDIVNYKVQFKRDNNLKIFDKKNNFSFDVENVLIKLINYNKNIDIQNIIYKYWCNNDLLDEKQYIFFDKVGKIDYYIQEDYTMNCSPHLENYFKFEELYIIDLLFGGLYILTDYTNEKITFKTINYKNCKIYPINFNFYKNSNMNQNIFGQWFKKESSNEFDLPKKLIFSKHLINISDKVKNYRFGIDHEYIILENNNCIKVELLSEKELQLTYFDNTIHQKEIAYYTR